MLQKKECGQFSRSVSKQWHNGVSGTSFPCLCLINECSVLWKERSRKGTVSLSLQSHAIKVVSHWALFFQSRCQYRQTVPLTFLGVCHTWVRSVACVHNTKRQVALYPYGAVSKNKGCCYSCCGLVTTFKWKEETIVGTVMTSKIWGQECLSKPYQITMQSFNFHWMEELEFYYLLEMVAPLISKQDTRMRKEEQQSWTMNQPFTLFKILCG